jgi:hypothetical protein
MNHMLSPKQFLRAAYMWRHGKDIPDRSLCEDTRDYDELGRVPQYCKDYLAHVYGVEASVVDLGAVPELPLIQP